MKAILEFSLPEEDGSFYDAMSGGRYKLIISELFDWINTMQDYGKGKVTLEDFRNIISEKLKENGVEL